MDVAIRYVIVKSQSSAQRCSDCATHAVTTLARPTRPSMWPWQIHPAVTCGHRAVLYRRRIN